MHIQKLKVRPRKTQPFNPCAAELMTMLTCWTATGDIHSGAACAEASQTLVKCMRTTPFASKSHKPTINYHLNRLSKNLK